MALRPIATIALRDFDHDGRFYAKGDRVDLLPLDAALQAYKGRVRVLPVGYVWPEAEAAFRSRHEALVAAVDRDRASRLHEDAARIADGVFDEVHEHPSRELSELSEAVAVAPRRRYRRKDKVAEP